jgi:hypothetical protein
MQSEMINIAITGHFLRVATQFDYINLRHAGRYLIGVPESLVKSVSMPEIFRFYMGTGGH